MYETNKIKPINIGKIVILPIWLSMIALLFVSCATKEEMTKEVTKINEQIDSGNSKTDNLIFELKNKTLKEQELSAKQAILELEGKQNTQEYKALKQELASLRGEMSSLNKRLLELERAGKLTQVQVSEIAEIVHMFKQDKLKQKERDKKILVELENEWRDIDKKYNTKGSIIK